MKRAFFSTTFCILALQIIFLLPSTGWSYLKEPVANAGGPYTIEMGNGVTLDGTLSTDADLPNDYIKVASWDINHDSVFDFTFYGSDSSNPANLILSLSAADLASFGLTQVYRPYRVQLMVTDSTDLTGYNETTLLIGPRSTPVPIPASLLLLASGLIGLLGIRRKIKN